MFILEPKSIKQLVNIPTLYSEIVNMDKISFLVLGGIILGGKELMDSGVALCGSSPSSLATPHW